MQAVSPTKDAEDVDPNELSCSFTHNDPEDIFADGWGHGIAPIPYLSEDAASPYRTSNPAPTASNGCDRVQNSDVPGESG